jgi:hypothetical protein
VKTWLNLLGAGVVFIGGMLVGRYWLAPAPVEPTPNTVEASQRALQELRGANARLSAELQQLRAAPARTVASAGAGPGAIAVAPVRATGSEWQTLAALKKKKLADSHVAVLAASGEIDSAFAALFELKPAERDVLQRTVTQSKEELAELERQHATVSRDPDGKVTIVVPAFAAEGGNVYDEMMGAFRQTLGPDRYAAFVTLGAEQLEKALANFGAQERTITFSYDPKQKTPYTTRDEFRMGQGSNSVRTSSFTSRENLEMRFGTISRLVPADFGQKK